MVETTPTKTKSKTKTKTTIAALIVIATIIALPLAANKVAFAAGAPTPTAGPTMLKLTTPNAPVVIPLVKGLYDKKDIFAHNNRSI
jgi:hypothetical protein